MPPRRAYLILLVCVCASFLTSAALPVGFSSTGPPVDGMTDEESRIRPRRSPESLCPTGWDQMSCFHAYLRMYARLHDEAHSQIDDVTVRGIGKRLFNPSHSSLCPQWMAPEECQNLNRLILHFFRDAMN